MIVMSRVASWSKVQTIADFFAFDAGQNDPRSLTIEILIHTPFSFANWHSGQVLFRFCSNKVACWREHDFSDLYGHFM